MSIHLHFACPATPRHNPKNVYGSTNVPQQRETLRCAIARNGASLHNEVISSRQGRQIASHSLAELTGDNHAEECHWKRKG